MAEPLVAVKIRRLQRRVTKADVLAYLRETQNTSGLSVAAEAALEKAARVIQRDGIEAVAFVSGEEEEAPCP